MVHAADVLIRAVLGELRESADVVEKGDHLGQVLLTLIQGKLLGQVENLLARLPRMLLLQSDVDVDVFVVAVKAACVFLEPVPEPFHLFLFHVPRISKSTVGTKGHECTDKDRSPSRKIGGAFPNALGSI
jgi:hypothetical protein